MQFHTTDWLSNKELRRCSPFSRALLIDLMCMAAEGTPFGFIADTVGALDDRFLAGRFNISLFRFRRAKRKLLDAGHIQERAGLLCIPEMVEAGRLPVRRDIPVHVRVLVLSVGACAHCGTTEKLTVDHVTPVARGGTNELENLQCLCLTCNSSKGAR